MSGKRPRVFDETYKKYLCEISEIDYLAKAESLGLRSIDGALRIPLYNTMYSFDGESIVGDDLKPLTPAV